MSRYTLERRSINCKAISGLRPACSLTLRPLSLTLSPSLRPWLPLLGFGAGTGALPLRKINVFEITGLALYR